VNAATERKVKATLCVTFDNMGRAREIGEGLAARPDENEPSLAIGYPRLLDLLDALGLRGTFFIEGWNALHHPARVEELARRGHEVGLHGWVHEKFAALEKLRAEQVLHDGTVALERIGLRPAGFRAPGGLRGEHTVPLLGELGFRYDSSSASASSPRDASTQPSLLAPGLAHLPWHEDMVDSIQYLRHPQRPRTPAEMEALWRAGIDRAAASGDTVTLVMHAFVSAVDDARFAVLRSVLEYASGRPDLEIVTARAVAERVLGGVHS
jgi:peptidoglycan-N-acetylglucosamine deacetylase